MRRVTHPGGLIVVYEHNPIPLTLKFVHDCELDDNAVPLTMEQTRDAPAPISGLVEKLGGLFAKLPFGSQHRAAREKKMSSVIGRKHRSLEKTWALLAKPVFDRLRIRAYVERPPS